MVYQKMVNQADTATNIEHPSLLRIADVLAQQSENQASLDGHESIMILADPAHALIHNHRVLFGVMVEAIYVALIGSEGRCCPGCG